MRAALYARVSSDAQRDRHTVASQLSALPAFAKTRGWTVVDTYVDDGKTAKAGHLEKRDAFARLLADARAGRIDVVVVVDLDRLTRAEDLRERGEVLGAFQSAGVQIAVASTGQVLDLRSSMGDLMSSLGAFFAAEENRKRRERTVRGKLEAIGQGRKPAGPTPFGYLYDRVTRTWSIDPDLGPIVQEIYRRVADGETCVAIADDLHARGVMRARPSKSGRRAPGRMNAVRVWGIARATTYLGEWVADKGRGLRVPVPPIVTQEQYDAAQHFLSRDGKRGLVHSKHVYLCDGNLAVCSYCGDPIRVASGYNDKERGSRPAYYICARRRKAPEDGGERCMLPMRLVSEVDGRLWAALEQLLRHPQAVRDAVGRRRAQADADAGSWEWDARAAEKALERLARIEVQVLERYRRGLVSERAWEAELRQIARERAQHERQLAAARKAGQGARSERAAADSAVEAAAAAWRGLQRDTPQRRRELARALIPLGGVTLGATEVEATLLLEDPRPVAVPALATGSSSKQRNNQARIRVVA
jgi:site-specific DNA recombinase